MAVRLLTQADVGRLLGVDRRQVHMWAKRRQHNGFPEPVKTLQRGRSEVPLYDPAQVKNWRRRYVPSNGGRQKVV